MKKIKLEIEIATCTYKELSEDDRQLIDQAKLATTRSYAPYSRFSVGAAALLNNGVVVTGTNQENAAYPSALDIGVFVSWKKVRLPGTENMDAEYRKNVIPSLKGGLYGILIGIPVCLVCGWILTWF